MAMVYTCFRTYSAFIERQERARECLLGESAEFVSFFGKFGAMLPFLVTHTLPSVRSNGERYEGHWKDGVRQGEGMRYNRDGTVWRGMWERDKKHGEGCLLFPHGNESAYCLSLSLSLRVNGHI